LRPQNKLYLPYLT